MSTLKRLLVVSWDLFERLTGNDAQTPKWRAGRDAASQHHRW